MYFSAFKFIVHTWKKDEKNPIYFEIKKIYIIFYCILKYVCVCIYIYNL